MTKFHNINNSQYQTIENAIDFISKNHEVFPSIDSIAKHVGLSNSHFTRLFKLYVGISPKQFLQCFTLNVAKKTLKNSTSILDASTTLGMSSVSRIHDLFVSCEGITPLEWKTMAKDVTIEYGYVQTPFGDALLGSTARGVCFFEFIQESKDISLEQLKEYWLNANFIYADLQKMCDEMFSLNSKFKLFIKGTAFQMQVWKALLKLPFGQLSTYSDIANYIDKPKAVRAVASAIGKNSIAYFIPCHRVIATSGALAGYKWGLNRKALIINYENINKENI